MSSSGRPTGNIGDLRRMPGGAAPAPLRVTPEGNPEGRNPFADASKTRAEALKARRKRAQLLLSLGFRLQNLAAAIYAGLGVEVVGSAQFAGILVFHVGGLLERIGGTTHAPARRRRLSFRHGHGRSPCNPKEQAVAP